MLLRACIFILSVAGPIAALGQWQPTGATSGSIYYNGGNVGIGTTTPSNTQGWNTVLDVSAPIASKILATASSQAFRLGLYAHSQWYGGGGFVGTETNHDLHFITNYSSKMMINTAGDVGVGTTSPQARLHVYGGHFLIDAPGNPTIYTGIGSAELNKYLALINSPVHTSASGLKAGGVLVSDTYSFANPGKNDLIVKGSVGVGIAAPESKFHVQNGGQGLKFLTGVNTSGYVLSIGVNDDGVNFSNNSAIRGFNFSNHSGNLLTITSAGNVGIGTTSPDARLAVKGDIHTREVKVDLSGAVGPDYVFEPDYKLLSLAGIESYIKANKHLPEVPSARQMEEEGLNLKEMNLLLLKKIEELTLHAIAQNKQIIELQHQVNNLKKKVGQ